MTREELIEKMCEAYDYPDGPADYSVCRSDGGKRHRHEMAAALDVAVGELLGEGDALEHQLCADAGAYASYGRKMLELRRSRYLKPKSDPAVEAVREVLRPWTTVDSQDIHERVLREIVAAVRNADKGASNA